MRLAAETIRHLAEDTGMAPEDIDPHIHGGRTLADHLAQDTGLRVDEVGGDDGDPTAALAQMMPAD